MCGTVKQEVDTKEEEAALFDNTQSGAKTPPNMRHAEGTHSYP